MNLNLSNLPRAFGDVAQAPANEPGVSEIETGLLDEFSGHPYSVNDDDAMDELVESIRRIGIATPLLVRPANGRYQIISGHRRAHAARIAGLDHVPAVIRDMDDDTAVITMVDSNKTRPNIPLSEQARAMLMRHDAILYQGSRNDDGETTRQQLGKENESSEKTVARLVQLGRLDGRLMPHLDDGSLPARSGLQIVMTKPGTQQKVADWLEGEKKRKLGESQAKKIRALDERQDEELDPGTIAATAAEDGKPKAKECLRIPRNWIPDGMDDSQAVEWIRRAINEYRKAGQ